MSEPTTVEEWQKRWLRVRNEERQRVLRIEQVEERGFVAGARVLAPLYRDGRSTWESGTIRDTCAWTDSPLCVIEFDSGPRKTFFIDQANIQIIAEAW